MSHSLVIIKPDAVRRGLVFAILADLKPLTLERMELRTLTAAEVESLYQHHADKPFFPRVRDFMTSGPSVVLVVGTGQMICTAGGVRTIAMILRECYSNLERESNPAANVVHASETYEDAMREINIFYPDFQWLIPAGKSFNDTSPFPPGH